LFYENSINALSHYLSNINDTITVNNFFGKNPNDFETGVGELVAGLTNDYKLSTEQKELLTKKLKDYWVSPKTGKRVQLYKNVAYLTQLTNIKSSMTQIQDLSLSLYKNGFFDTAKSIFTPSKVTAAELGISEANEELEGVINTIFKGDTGLEKANKIMNKLLKTNFKLSLFTTVDRFGKNTFINASLNKYTNLAKKKDTKKIFNEIRESFGDLRAEKIIEDLKAGNISKEVKQFLFYKIADVMPIARTEMPSLYSRRSGARAFYTFKTYAIKQLDILNRDVWQELKEGNPTKAFRNLTYLSAFYVMIGVPLNKLKDFIFNGDNDDEKEIVNDYVVDNLLQVFGINKYNIYSFKRDKLNLALFQLAGPPLPVLGDLLRDIIEDREFEDWRSLQNIPVGGKPYYWWFGGGSE